MPIYDNLEGIRRLTNASLTSIIDITNLNFRDLSDANLEFLNNIAYDETLNSFQVYKGTFDFVDVTDTLTMKLDGVPTFTIDSLGRANGQELLVKVAETKRLRLTDFNDWPDIGVPGEIIYTGVQNQKPQFGEDFIGYLQGRGWVSLTDNGGSAYITLTELTGSPPTPPCPGNNQGIIWIGPPGYQTVTVPTTQTLYYTDENCQIFDLLLVNGGGATAGCSFITIGNFAANTTATIVHNLGSTSLIIQLIDQNNNELIDAYIDNYQANSFDITTTQTVNNVKVVVIVAGCTGDASVDVEYNGTLQVDNATTLNFIGDGVTVVNAGGGIADINIAGGAFGNRKVIPSGITINVLQDYQYWIYGNLTIGGVLNNAGEVVIANGTLILLPGGQYNTVGSGNLLIVNLATGVSMQTYVQNFTTTANVPLTIVHNLGTMDVVYSARENSNFSPAGPDVVIDLDVTFIDDNTITIETTGNIEGTIVIQAQL